MSKPTAVRPAAFLTATALAVSALAAVALAPAPASAADRTVALVGSLQSELGCTADWAPDCAESELAPTGAEGIYSTEFEVPAGTYEYKVAINDAWDEAYGLDGGADNIPLTIAGPATLRFTFDDNLKRVGVEVVDLRGAYTADDEDLIADPVRQAGAGEQFYFVRSRLRADRRSGGRRG